MNDKTFPLRNLRYLIREELTKTDKADIKTMIRKELESEMKAKLSKTVKEEVEKALKDKATKDQIGEVSKKIIKKRIGVDIIYWRNHGYRSDKNTNKILDSLNFKYVSNDVNQQSYYEEIKLNNLISRPINTFPDHENLHHSSEHKGGINPDEWVSLNTINIKKIIKDKGLATLLLHPLCMYLENEFTYMKKLLYNLK